MQGMKKAEIKINGKKVRLAVVNGIGNAKKVLEELKKNRRAYDGVEVMACYGGCIGGGGQPLPADAKIRRKRAESLYKIDAKKTIRTAQENPIIRKVYKDFLKDKEIIHKICHAKYYSK